MIGVGVKPRETELRGGGARGVVGHRVGPYAIGFFADLFESRDVAAPLTKALLGTDMVVLVALVLYLRLHFAIRARSA